MNVLEKLRLDKWWAIVLYVGILCIGVGFISTEKFIDKRHLVGLGLGAFLLGLSFFIAEKRTNYFVPTGILWSINTKHTFISRIIQLIGIALILFFGFRVLRALF